MVQVESPEKRLIQAGRKTRDALRTIRDTVRAKRKANIYDKVFADLEAEVEEATDGLIDISSIFEEVIHKDGRTLPPTQETRNVDVSNLHELQNSLKEMRRERENLLESLQDAKEQLQRYADDLQVLYAQEREKRVELADAYERLQQADRLKADFLSTVNHELSSPLVPLDISLQLISKGDLNTEQRAGLSEAQGLLAQYKRQVDGLVKYAALVSQTHVMHPEPIKIEALLEETLETLYLFARGRDINLQVEPIAANLTLVADPGLVSGAIYQLAHNAIRHNKARGHVNISAKAESGGVLFQIEDDGHGIPPAVMQRFGEDFNQIVDALRRGVEGLGLGLAFSKYVASIHEGELNAKPASSKGTIIQLWLPA